MSDRALKEFREIREKQLDRYQARHIRSKVKDAKGASEAKTRWPFELLQNATDAGPRDGRESIAVSLAFAESSVRFSHDGVPFTHQELAALLSGGSSKEFESSETTGRFGTGFLVTHVLAERTKVSGLLKTSEGLEHFGLTINRAGDEDQILENIEACNDAIAHATPCSHLDNLPSASFEYLGVDAAVFADGFEALKEALPYLYLTRPQLGRVSLRTSESVSEEWLPDASVGREETEGGVVERTVQVEKGAGSDPVQYRVFRVSKGANCSSSLLFATKRDGAGWSLSVPKPDFPRMFIRFPIRFSSFLTTCFVIDAPFDPDQERRTIHLNEQGKSLLSQAFEAAPTAMQCAVTNEIANNHLLAQVGVTHDSFKVLPESERKWWLEELKRVAQHFGGMALVNTRNGMLPALHGSENQSRRASFVSRSWAGAKLESPATIEPVWALVDEVEHFSPPVIEVAEDWSRITEEWGELGVRVSQISLTSLAAGVRENARTVKELPVTGDPLDWIAKFFDVVGQAWILRKGTDLDVLQGLVPDQHGRLCSTVELRRDEGVAEDLKNIAERIGLNVRAKLLSTELLERAQRLDLKHFANVIAKAIPGSLSEKDLLDECVTNLERRLKEDERADSSQDEIIMGSVRLLGYLWKSRGSSASDIARKCPLIAADGTVVRWSPQRVMMAPVASWHEAARPFKAAYPMQRVLDSVYCDSDSERGMIPHIVDALVAWGMAHKDPLGKNRPIELKDERLAALAVPGQNTSGMVVTGEEFSQISLLLPEVINNCREDRSDARALLGLVLCYMAAHDECWRKNRAVTARRAGSQSEIRVCEALWLADLMSKAWVPVVGEGGKTTPGIARAETLKDLLDLEWLSGNSDAVALLTAYFGFDELDLRLLGVTDPIARQEIRNTLAELIEFAAGNPAAIKAYSDELQEKQRHRKEIQRCRDLGLAVQAAVKDALERRNLKVEVVDRGFDFEVSLPEEASVRFGVGEFLVEVKATTTGEVRLTPTQAETAGGESERYFLCVIDLRNVPQERLEGSWSAADVEPLTRITGNIGTHTKQTFDLIEEARGNQVSIRNEKALRYAVPIQFWAGGSRIDDWVAQLLPSGAL